MSRCPELTVVSLRLWLAASLLALCTLAHAAAPIPLRLIGINDFHGNLEPTGLSLQLADPQAPEKQVKVAVGGAPALAGLVQALRAGAPNSLMISGGDLIGASPLVSTLFRHESTIAVMNAIGLDVSVTGNHEFDQGINELKRVALGGCAATVPDAIATSCTLDGRYPGARFTYIAANVLDAKGHPVFAPYLIKRVHGVRVAVIGAVTKTAPSLVVPSGVAGLSFIDEADAVNRSARRLRAMGVRAMVAVFHEGGEIGPVQQRGDWNDVSCPEAQGPIFDIAKRLTRDVGVIFSAHTHQGYRCIVDGRVIIQGTSYGRGISVVDTVLDPATRNFVPADTRSVNLPVLNDNTDPALRERLIAALPAPYADVMRAAHADPAIAAMVARYAAVIAPKAERPVGSISGSFVRGGKTDSAAGRLIADAQLAAVRAPEDGGAQLSFMNAGGIRSDLACRGTPPCVVNFGQAFSMQPFGNDLVVMTLTGAQIKRLLEQQQKPGAEMMVLQPSDGFAYAWQADAPPGEHARNLALNGEPVVPERSYRVVVNSFMAEGGDGFTVLKEGTDRRTGPHDIDAMLAYLKAGERAPADAPRMTLLP